MAFNFPLDVYTHDLDVMCCKSKAEKIDFAKLLVANGRKWCSGTSYLEGRSLDLYDEDGELFFFFNRGTRASNRGYCEEVGANILELEDFYTRESLELSFETLMSGGRL